MFFFFFKGYEKTSSSSETVPAQESGEKSKRSPFVLIQSL